MTKLLLTGASGMLGSKILDKIEARRMYEIFTVGRHELKKSNNHFVADISDSRQLLQVLEACEPEIIINCGAYVDLNYCETNHNETDLLHQHAVSILSSYKSVKILYYISTDSVFDGQRGNYTEEDITNPLNYYATSKLNGEIAALNTHKKIYIIRTNIFGFGSKAGKSLFEWAYKNLSDGSAIHGYANVYFNPLYVGYLAQMLVEFMDMDCCPGIYNFGSQPGISKYAFLLKIANIFEFNNNLIKTVDLDNSQLNAIRPLNTTLNTNKISNLGIKVPDIDTCIHNLYNDITKWH